MIIELARHKRAQHKVVPVKRLMHRRRLVQPTGYRFKIVYRKSPGIVKAVPADEIERVRTVNVWVDQFLLFNQDLKISLLIVGLQILRTLNIAFAIRRMFRQLTELVSIAFRRADRPETFYNKQSVIFGIKLQLVNGTAGNYQVIAICKFNVAEPAF